MQNEILSKLKHEKILVGFHLHKPNYDFEAVRGQLFNEITDILDITPEIRLSEEGYELKLNNNDLFSIRYTPAQIIYQDKFDDEERFIDNALRILKAWQSMHGKAETLRLCGLMKGYSINEKIKSDSLFLYSTFLKQTDITGTKKEVDIKFTYEIDDDSSEYNINLFLHEIDIKNYKFKITFDVNQIDEDNSKHIDFEQVKHIFSFANKIEKPELGKFLR